MEPKDKIDILLKEYDTLREEALARMKARFAFLGLICGIITVGLSEKVQISGIWLGMLAVALLGLWFYFGHLLHKIHLGIKKIEAAINSLAGEKLLTWESDDSSRLFEMVHGSLVAEGEAPRESSDPPASITDESCSVAATQPTGETPIRTHALSERIQD